VTINKPPSVHNTVTVTLHLALDLQMVFTVQLCRWLNSDCVW